MSRFATLGTLKEVQLTQGTIRYREIGTGEPLVFIHGFLVNGDLWRKVVPLLAKNYRCIAPDLPLGAHEIALNPDADLTPTGVARIVANFIEALELRNVTLIGNDSGGAISQLVITEYPQYFARLVLFDCDAFENFPPLIIRPLQWAGNVMPLLIGYLKLEYRLKRPIIIRMVAKKPVEQAAIDSYFQPILSNKGVQRDAKKFLKGISNRYTKHAATKFADFTQPVLIIWTREDIFFPVKDGERLSKTFPNARLELVKDARTFISEDQPEKLAELIKTFIAQNALVEPQKVDGKRF